MSKINKILWMDFETYSEVDIGKCGSFRYIEDDSFEPLLLAYGFDNEPIKLVDFTDPRQTWPKEFLDALDDTAVTKIAHNCAFERAVIAKELHYSPAEQWFDTMHLTAQCGLPLSLGGAGDALGLSEDQAKIKDGKMLIRYFCLPCKATKANGERTRNYPEHDQEKWKRFCEYCVRDVETMRTIYRRLERWLPNDLERKLWAVDARINEHGVRIDKLLAKNAVAMDVKNKEELTKAAVKVSGLDNPKSVAQIKQWLFDQEGQEYPSLNKKVIAEVVGSLQSDKAKEFMAIRSELSKSSVSKYDAMLRSMCNDDHVKGCFQFYGATHTGRWAGRLVQFQNLSKNHDENLDGMREMVKGGHYTAVKAIYDGVADPLSQLVRTAIIPEENSRILVADYSAIEARVLAWLAGEEWRLQTFRNGGDIYCESASQAFHMPVVKHGVNGHMRQVGKTLELACIAEGEEVLTDVGLVPIENVTTGMKVWDGENFVEHEGVVCNGWRDVIEYDGLKATTDHFVWVEGERWPIQFGDAATCGTRLVQTGDGRNEIRLGRNHISRKEMERDSEQMLRTSQMHILRENQMDKLEQSATRSLKWMPTMLTAEKDTSLARQTTNRCKAEMRESEGQGIQKIRREGNKVRVRKCFGSRSIHSEYDWHTRQINGTRPYRYKWKLCKGKSPFCIASRKQHEQTNNGTNGMGPTILAILLQNHNQEAIIRDDEGRSNPRGKESCSRETEKLARYCGKARVYDIRNAGPNHCYTVSGKLVHNCGYGGSVGGMKAFGADKMGLSEEEMQEDVDKWRAASPNIVNFWHNVESAAIRAVAREDAYVVEGPVPIMYMMDHGVLWCNLPSGRRIAYWGATYEESKKRPGKKSLFFMGVDQKTKRWGKIELWYGVLVENIVQATARDLLGLALINLENEGYQVIAHVHDECIVTSPLDSGQSVEEMSEIMARGDKWSDGLPLRADGYSGTYYFKD